MIIKGSRYEASVGIKNDEIINTSKSTRFSTNKYIVIITKEGDSFELLASRYLQSPYLYWKIADCNRTIQYPDFLEPGTFVRIPLT